MVSIGTKLAAVCAGALTYWLCVPAETPVVDYRACCSAATWAQIANLGPAWPRRHATALIARGAKPHSWTVAGFDGKPALSVTLPEPVDRVLGGNDDGVPAAPRAGAPLANDGFHGPGPTETSWVVPYRWRPCKHNDERPWCKKGRPPVAGVPEPGVWALMLTGVLVLGAALRFGRRGPVSAISAR